MNVECTRDWKFLIITARKRSLGQGNIFSSVCQEFCSQGGLPQCMLGYHHPRTRHPPKADTPWEQTTPCAVHAGRYGQQAGGMHPTGMQSCFSMILSLTVSTAHSFFLIKFRTACATKHSSYSNPGSMSHGCQWLHKQGLISFKNKYQNISYYFKH